MTALLRKDFIEAFTSFRSILLITLVFGIMPFFIKNASFMAAYLVIFPGSLASSLVTLEEREKWDSYSMTLPVTRKQCVASKYIFSLILLTAGTLIITLINAVNGMPQLLDIFMLYMSIGLLMPAALLPLTYIFGAEKAKYISMILIILITLFAINYAGDSSSITSLLTKVQPFMIFIAVIILFGLSWFVSSAFYEKKELH